jgi:hypothetical protein
VASFALTGSSTTSSASLVTDKISDMSSGV